MPYLTSASTSRGSTWIEASVTSATPQSAQLLRLALEECAADYPLAATAAKATWESLAAVIAGRLQWTIERLQVAIHDSDASCTTFANAAGEGTTIEGAVVTLTAVARDRFVAILSPTSDAGAPAPRESIAVHAHFERSTLAAADARHAAPDVRQAEAVLRSALAPWLSSDGRRGDGAARLAEDVWQRLAEALSPGHGWSALRVILESARRPRAEFWRAFPGGASPRAPPAGAHTVVAGAPLAPLAGARIETRLCASSAAAVRPGAAAGALAALEAAAPLQALLDQAVRVEEMRAELCAAAAAVAPAATATPAAATSAAAASPAEVAARVWRMLALSPAARRWARVLAAARGQEEAEAGAEAAPSLEVRIEAEGHSSRYSGPLGSPPPSSAQATGGGGSGGGGGGEEDGGGAAAAIVLDLDHLATDYATDHLATDYGAATPTGIVHATPLGRLVAAMPCPAFAVSALPAADALRRLHVLQLGGCGLAGLFTPDSLGPAPLASSPLALPLDPALPGTEPAAPMAPAGEAFWRQLAAAAGYAASPALLHLLSESDAVRAAAAAAGVGVGARPLGAATAADPNPPDRALLSALRCCSSIATDAAARCAYLAAKVPIDEAALCTSVAAQLRDALAVTRAAAAGLSDASDARGGGTLRVTDVGAGGLSMLPRLARLAAAAGYAAVEYLALEADVVLVEAACRRLQDEEGFVLAAEAVGAAAGATVEAASAADAAGAAALRGALVAKGWCGLESLTLRCRAVDALAASDAADAAAGGDLGPAATLRLPTAPPQLLVACAFADLLPPRALLALLCKLCPGGLVYLPITFAGATRLAPAFAGSGSLPSDAAVMDAYHRHLETNEGQFLDVPALLATAIAAGAALLAQGASPWRIPADAPFQPYMLDFLGAGTADALWREGYDAAGWCAHARARRATVEADNLDLLLRMPEACAPVAPHYAGLEFVAPRSVRLARRDAPLLPHGAVAAGMAELRSVVSMVRSGRRARGVSRAGLSPPRPTPPSLPVPHRPHPHHRTSGR